MREEADGQAREIKAQARVEAREITSDAHVMAREVLDEGTEVSRNLRELSVSLRNNAERLLRDMVFGTIEHSTWRFLRGEGDFDHEELADEITMVVYQGMSAQASKDDRIDAIDAVVSRLEAVAGRLEGSRPAE